MTNFKEKRGETFSDSRLNFPTGDTIALRDYLNTGGNASALFSPAKTLDDSMEPMPSMFRATGRTPERGPALPAGRPPKSDIAKMTAGAAPYAGAVVLCALVAGAAIHVSLATPSATNTSVVAAPIQATNVNVGAGVTPAAASDTSPVERETWSQTVETYKQVLAQQKMPPAKNTEQDRLIGQLEAWMNGKPR
jgi:hypothetical protein